MKTTTAIAAVLALAVTGCGLGNSNEAAPPEATSRSELDAAVAAGASELLASDQVTVAIVYFGADDPEEVTQYRWVDYRPDGDVLVVDNYLEEDRREASLRVAGEWWVAADGGDAPEPWQTVTDLGEPEDLVTPISILRAMAEDGSNPSSSEDPGEVGETTQQTGKDYSHLWRIVFNVGPDEQLSHEWIVDNEGTLRFERILSTTSEFESLIVEYAAGDDPGQMGTPEAGSEIDLAKLGVPSDLIELGLGL